MRLPQKRRRHPLPSADAIAGNEDLMMEILIRLPAKSLCRFKCVSKRWYSLISHPHFSLLRLPHCVSGFFLSTPFVSKYIHLAGKKPRSSPFKSLTFTEDPTGVKIMDSCIGLLLISSLDGDSSEPNYYVYNPTTKQFAIIPPPSKLPNRYVSSWSLAFDPCREPHYRIVSLLSCVCPSDYRSRTYHIERYSSETGAWKFSGDSFTTTLHFTENGVFFNGKIHFPSSWYETWLLLDVDEECLTTIPMPTIPDEIEERTVKYFGESQGHLHLICGDDYSKTFHVLEIESDCSKCFVKYHVHLDDITTTFPQCPPDTRLPILHLDLREVEEESSLLFHIPGSVKKEAWAFDHFL